MHTCLLVRVADFWVAISIENVRVAWDTPTVADWSPAPTTNTINSPDRLTRFGAYGATVPD